jgi:hypothetical protein
MTVEVANFSGENQSEHIDDKADPNCPTRLSTNSQPINNKHQIWTS